MNQQNLPLSFHLVALIISLAGSFSLHADIIAQDDFSYADGDLASNGGTEGAWTGAWANNLNGEGIDVTSGTVTSGTVTGVQNHRVARSITA